MVSKTDPRPGVAYRRPDGDPSHLRVESSGSSEIPIDELPRDGWAEAVHPSDRDRLHRALDTENINVTYRVETNDETIWIRERGQCTNCGDVVGYLFPASDQVRRRRRLEQQRERLDEFASVVSHDLRNPMSVAVGNIELAREFEGESADERLDRAMEALDRMDALISDLLSLAREGRSVESTAKADLRTVVDQAWSTVGAAADATLVVDDTLPSIDCDRNRLRQALENLFRNAIEHGGAGDPDAVCSTAEAADPGDGVSPGTFERTDDDRTDATVEHGTGADTSVCVHVGRMPNGFYIADDGPGIDPEERDEVFEAGHTTAENGTGFGLAIVARIAEAHGWSVSAAESRTGGARFEFTDVDVIEDTRGSTAADSPTDDSGRSSAE